MTIWKTATIILIIILVLVGSLLGYLNIRTSTNLTNTKTTLRTTQVTLADIQNELSTTQSTLADTQAQLNITQVTLANTQVQLSTTQSQLQSTQNSLNTSNDQLKAYKAGPKPFPNLTTLENWITATVGNNKSAYIEAQQAGDLEIALYLQQQAAISGYILSTTTDWYFIDSDTTNPNNAHHWYYTVGESPVFIGDNSYIVACLADSIIIYDVDANMGIPGFIVPALSLWNNVWEQPISSMQPSI